MSRVHALQPGPRSLAWTGLSLFQEASPVHIFYRMEPATEVVNVPGKCVAFYQSLQGRFSEP